MSGCNLIRRSNANFGCSIHLNAHEYINPNGPKFFEKPEPPLQYNMNRSIAKTEAEWGPSRSVFIKR